MFGKSSSHEYQPLQQSGSVGQFVGTESFAHPQYHKGHSFDYIPKVCENDFTDSSQGWPSWICNIIVIFLVYICTFITFPISGWFVLKVVPNYQRIVVFRLGRVCPPKGPGVVLVLPLIDQWQRVDLRTRAFNIPPCQVTTRDGGVLSVGADIQFRIWNPAMSVLSVQDLNASTRLTAQNTMTHSLAKKTVKEIQTERVKLGEYLGMDINELTRPWGLEVDRVELAVGSLLKAPDSSTGPVIVPPIMPGLEGLTGPIQQLAMHFLSHSGPSQHQTEDSVTFTDELGGAPQAVVASPGSVEELLGVVRLLLSESLVSQVRACFQFHISSGDGQLESYFVDLSQGSGAAGAGSPCRQPDVTLSMSDSDLLAMFEGSLRPFAAYTGGRLKVQGDLKTAMKLEELIKLIRKYSSSHGLVLIHKSRLVRGMFRAVRGADCSSSPPPQPGQTSLREQLPRGNQRERALVGRMARWGLWCSPGMLCLSWTEGLVVHGVRHSSSLPVVRQVGPESRAAVRPFDEIPGRWKNGVANLYNFWKLDGFRNLHRIMVHNFNTFGPIYREKIGYYESVNIINPEDAALLFKAEGYHPKRLRVEPWTSYRDYRNRKYGVLLKDGEDWRNNRVILNKEVISPKVQGNFVPLLDEVGQDFVARVYQKIERSGQNKWTADFSHELFKYALESVSSVLYGERLGLMLDSIDPEAQHFIDCITLMFKTTSPMLYIPPGLLRRIGAKVWRDHVEAWDGIFNQADRCIQNIYKKLHQEGGSPTKYPGVLASLLMLNKLSIEDIKASVTELMAGGVDTTSITLLWTLYELARHPSLQEELRAEVVAARAEAQGDMLEVLKRVPLVKGALKETLRLHPVAVSLQRYTTEDIIIQNYHIPSGTLVQLGLYAMGRDPRLFARPEQYQPSRWLRTESHYFKSLGFGFGPRQCLGRRIAETEMQLFLIHMLGNFRVEKQRQAEVQSVFELILLPEKPIILTLKPLKGNQ
ncbi:cholesterol side-chain cleavage enzyme, mitochondrial-like [Lampris incognitus]|uniref:cholesterol side-chain cleavage enzyme, mitochondrial-like n=1 Tax=Lampris incognitus TaxID=2546036 RepID=UPI0024B5C4CC|nr:cholesterol side-chain cleavage enzyme, mitochondrial-like [Lampris incognitus]